ncbi:MAG TPA: hypothetical protein VN688_33325 [Gemmataceae bacterium]|nr:hypothetical protein [Gemmataceae bacterium]
MAAPVVELQGTLQADGTLVLDEKPNLPPGRVRVSVQPVLDYTQTDIWQFFERLREEQRARGHIPRSKEEIDADIAASRQEDEERMLEIERLQEECWRAREQQRKTEAS